MRPYLNHYWALEAINLLFPPAEATDTTPRFPHRPGALREPWVLQQNESAECSGQSSLNFTIQNNHGKPLFFYVTGKDPEADDNFVVLRKEADCCGWYTKPPNTDTTRTSPYYFVDITDESSGFHSEVQVNETVSFMLPGYASSARLYVSEERLRFGTNLGGPNEGFVEPSSTNNALPEYKINWEFIEFTYGKDNFILNPSYVDFASISVDLELHSGSSENAKKIPGLETNALDQICSQLVAQGKKDNQSWADLCLKDEGGNNIRAISPNLYLALHPDDKMSEYYAGYVDKVWSRYREEDLTINTQDDGSGKKVEQGNEFICRVGSDDLLWCDDGISFRKPTTAEIMGCVQTKDGPFAVTGWNTSLIVPRLCAAFTRSTLLLPDGNVQPNGKITADLYYNDPTTNHYSRIIHERLSDHMGYAFAYDDTNPASSDRETENAGGVIEDPDPRLLLITVR